MSEQEIVSCLKTIQGLLERLVNGNQQTHSLLQEVIKSINNAASSNP